MLLPTLTMRYPNLKAGHFQSRPGSPLLEVDAALKGPLVKGRCCICMFAVLLLLFGDGCVRGGGVRQTESLLPLLW